MTAVAIIIRETNKNIVHHFLLVSPPTTTKRKKLEDGSEMTTTVTGVVTAMLDGDVRGRKEKLFFLHMKGPPPTASTVDLSAVVHRPLSNCLPSSLSSSNKN
jgi:hypothetical protein